MLSAILSSKAENNLRVGRGVTTPTAIGGAA